ncbi:MAG: efflux RND transporter permease subunit [Dissulfurimicrobium hydrothermale]|uniref:efflux RND transporter permease subunit n=1 Tax=Dissulfurimicrobium hydrothermale TaxID=1750598 RepID=UPI003C7494A1
MNIADWIKGHHRSILFLIAVLALAGAAASLYLPVALFPYVEFPRVEVSLDAGDRPADLMAIEVTRPVEEAIRGVPGVRNVRSTTSRGSADISVNFDWSEDMVSAMLQVESAINQIRSTLPQGLSFTVRRMDPTVFPVLAYSLTSNTHSLVELRDIALYQLAPFLSTVKGVAKVEVQGGQEAEFQVMLDPAKMEALGLTVDDVAKALSASNVVKAVGRIEDHYRLYLAVSDTRLGGIGEIKNTVIRSGQNGLLRLDDIGTVTLGTVPQWIKVTADGRDAVLIQVYQQPRGNTVQIATDIKKKLAAFKPHLPSDIKIANWYDQSELILASAKSVRDAVFLGVLFAAVILWIFLRNARMTLIAAAAVPSVLAVTVLVLYLLHMRFDIMTLGGMAAAVGLIIDDMIVMEEHIVRGLARHSGTRHERIMAAMKELTSPLAGSSASTVIIFAPLAFLSGVTGAFFKALSLTMASALVVSFLVAWIGVPVLAAHLLKEDDIRVMDGGKGGIEQRFKNGYGWFMRCILDRAPLFLMLTLVSLAFAGWFSYKRLGSGFMPKMDEGGFILDYRTPPGTSLTETDRLLRQVEAILRATPEVDTYSRRTGTALGGFLTEANEGDFFVRLKPGPRRPIEAVMDEVRGRIERTIPGIQVEMAQLMEDLIGDLTAVPQPIEIKLFSDDQSLLGRLGPKVAQAISNIPGVVEVKDGIVFAGDALQIRVDRDKASFEGVDPEAVTRFVTQYLTGVVTTKIQENMKMVGVRVWVPEDVRKNMKDIENLQLKGSGGHLFPLKRIAKINILTGQPQIMHEDLKRMIAVTGRISGRDMGSVIRDVKKVLRRPGLIPKGVYYELGGLYEQQKIAFKGLITVFVAAVMLVFLLLLFLYERFRIALAILFTTLLSISAVFFGLWITGSEIDISSMMGITMIIGIVTEASIFYISELNAICISSTMPFKADLVEAGENRLRPIAMTTIAAILALMPLALGLGEGAAMLKPLAIAIVSGLFLQMPLVLVFLPILLSMLI